MAFAFLQRWTSRAKQRETVVGEIIRARQEESQLVLVMDAKMKDFIEARQGVPITKLTDYASYLSAGTGRVWATFRACHLVASTVTSAELSVINIKSGAVMPETQEPAFFLSQPNPFDSMEELIYLWVHHIKLTGNAYWLKDEPNAKGQPLGLYPLLPQFVKVIPHRTKKIDHYEYHVNGEIQRIEPEQMIHFKRPHPTDLIFGLGDVEAGQAVYNSYINRNELEDKFIANGAQPSGVLTRKNTDLEGGVQTQDQWDALKAKFNAEYTGRKNAGKVVFLNGDWSFVKMGLTMQEMEALEKERWTVEQIFLNHGVPLSVAGLKASANYATARQEDISFRRYECVPLLKLLMAKLNSVGGLALPYGDQLRFKFELSGLLDVEQVMKDYTPLVERGAMTPNELREKAGLSRITDNPLLDQYFIRNSLVPLEMSGLTGGGGVQDSDDEAKGIVRGADA